MKDAAWIKPTVGTVRVQAVPRPSKAGRGRVQARRRIGRGNRLLSRARRGRCTSDTGSSEALLPLGIFSGELYRKIFCARRFDGSRRRSAIKKELNCLYVIPF